MLMRENSERKKEREKGHHPQRKLRRYECVGELFNIIRQVQRRICVFLIMKTNDGHVRAMRTITAPFASASVI